MDPIILLLMLLFNLYQLELEHILFQYNILWEWDTGSQIEGQPDYDESWRDSEEQRLYHTG